jgi:hypothetical protein
MNDGNTGTPDRRLWRRRSLLISLLGLGAWLAFKKSLPVGLQADKTVLAGGWVLKQSDLT